MAPRAQSPTARGLSLIELMIAMAIISIGLLAMWHLHMVGISSNAAGRRHTVATALAGELVTGLERLPYGDPLIDVTHTGPPPAPAGAVFGNLVDGSGSVIAGAREWSDATPVPGVRLASQMRENAEGYERRWTVWGIVSPTAPAGAVPGVKLIAVSVVWRDPPFRRLREVVLYTQLYNPGALFSGLAGEMGQ